MSFRVMSISGFYRNLYSLVVVVLRVLIFSGIFVGHVCVCALLSTWVEPRLLGKVWCFLFFGSFSTFWFVLERWCGFSSTHLGGSV